MIQGVDHYLLKVISDGSNTGIYTVRASEQAFGSDFPLCLPSPGQKLTSTEGTVGLIHEDIAFANVN